SFFVNGSTAESKEYALLAISMGAYPACRFITDADISGGRRSFVAAASLITVAGLLATVWALVTQWDHPHGKPMVFGSFDAAGNYFLQLLGLLILAVVLFGKLP